MNTFFKSLYENFFVLFFVLSQLLNYVFYLSTPKPEDFIFSNDVFKIVFDLPTPRNHMIILFKHDSYRKSRRSVKDLDEDELRSLIHLVDGFNNEFIAKHEEVILSFHTGYWVNLINFEMNLKYFYII